MSRATRGWAYEARSLQLAVGDGRIAIPLAASGVEVDGISGFALHRKYTLTYCIAASFFNVTTQDGQIWLSSDGIAFSPHVPRYASLGELDLMARIAGLQKSERWGGWTREPYNAASPTFLATYMAPTGSA